MTFEAKIIEDSISNGVRLTTMQLKYPRLIHSEFMTHRVFSRNASSSRAIPVAKMIEQVRNEPAMPIHWGANQAGMQAREELTGADLAAVQAMWKKASQDAANHAGWMAHHGAHKQIVNRILEPFQWISVVCTATEWDNFFELRAHPDAQPEIQRLAVMMREAMVSSSPIQRLAEDYKNEKGWHLPYVLLEERIAHANAPLHLAKLSAARCARVSYLTHDGQNPSVEKDLELFDRLVGGKPIHASPTEHQACPLLFGNAWVKNFRGWKQHRDFIESSMSKNKENNNG